MKWSLITLLVLASISPVITFGHPGSGIAVDSQGSVFFVDTGSGVWQLQSGKLSKMSGPAYHWMALDRTGRLSKTELPYFADGQASLARVEHNLLLASDFPISVDSGGALYFSRLESNQLRVFRLAPSGSTTTFATITKNAKGEAISWINGSAIGSDGTFYFTEDHGVWKITPQKELVLVSTNLPAVKCGVVPGVGSEFGISFRGIDIDSNGNVFVAATACQAVLKIATDKTVAILSRTTGAWAPTGIATSGSDVYVLEYFHTVHQNRREWIPRVRRISADGTESIVATVDR